MNTIHVKASKEYDVIIGSQTMPLIGKHIKNITNAQRIVVISDDNVWPLYGNTIIRSLETVGFNALSYAFPAGEESKTATTYINILNFLAENQITRSDALIALGGGVVGDMCGFVAATYLRGIPYIQVPTTLLAMVDSSVGGKTAIDLPAGKNLVGAIYQPDMVICDIVALNTLPEHIFRDGCAEVIKYGILYDADLFAHLSDNGLQFDRETVVSRCVALKRDVVATDEFDKGERQKLNLGHTIGHSIELLSNFGVSHGTAVAIGMATIAKAAFANKICNTETLQRILSILEEFLLPTQSQYSAEDLCKAAMGDKKRTGDTINLIVPEHIGNCIIKPLHINDLLSFVKAGL